MRTVRQIHWVIGQGEGETLTDREWDIYYSTCSRCFSEYDCEGNCANYCEDDDDFEVHVGREADGRAVE